MAGGDWCILIPAVVVNEDRNPPIIKGAVSPMFSITVKTQKRICDAGNLKHNGPVLLNGYSIAQKTINKCVWLRMTRMEVDSTLKTTGRFFQVFASVSDKIGNSNLTHRYIGT